MLVYSQQKNFYDFFCLGHQHGRYVYCLLCLLGLCENALYCCIIQYLCKSQNFQHIGYNAVEQTIRIRYNRVRIDSEQNSFGKPNKLSL